MVATARGAELNEVPLPSLMPPKDEISRRGANTAVACMEAMPFPAAAMPLKQGSSFLTQSISKKPNWLRD